MLRLRSIRERLRLSLWFVPAVLASVAAVVAIILSVVDDALAASGAEIPVGFQGSPEGARSVLATIAQSMLTFTGLVFTITMLVLQLASSQLSPRVMRTFLRDRGNQLVLGLFVATFVFTLIVLREVRTPIGSGEAYVPAISVWVAFSLLLASVGAFVWYIDHMAHAIRASTVIANIWEETVGAVEARYPERISTDLGAGASPRWHDPDCPPVAVLTAPAAGVVTGVDDAALRSIVANGDRILAIVPAIGAFVAEGAPLARTWGDWDREAGNGVRSAVEIGAERTLDEDVAFGFRQLVDVAIRALSPGTNDPTTAVQALDRIHDLLRRLAVRVLPSGVIEVDGAPRLLIQRPGWDDFVRLGVEEIRLAGATQVQVRRRLRVLLDDLEAVAPHARQAVLHEQRRALDLAAD